MPVTLQGTQRASRGDGEGGRATETETETGRAYGSSLGSIISPLQNNSKNKLQQSLQSPRQATKERRGWGGEREAATEKGARKSTTTIVQRGMGKRQRALLHEHIVALCAIIVAIMARQLSVLALALSQVNANRDREREGDGGGEKERDMGASSFGAVPHSERKPRTSANQHCQAQSTQSTQSTHTAAPQSLT